MIIMPTIQLLIFIGLTLSKEKNIFCQGTESWRAILQVTKKESTIPGRELKPQLSSLGPTQNMRKPLFSAVKNGEKGTHIC